jgi:hypothetical protein
MNAVYFSGKQEAGQYLTSFLTAGAISEEANPDMPNLQLKWNDRARRAAEALVNDPWFTPERIVKDEFLNPKYPLRYLDPKGQTSLRGFESPIGALNRIFQRTEGAPKVWEGVWGILEQILLEKDIPTVQILNLEQKLRTSAPGIATA